VKVAASWSKRSGIGAATLREVGVPARRARQGEPLNRQQPPRAPEPGSCRNAITMPSVMVDEIRLRARARPLGDAQGNIAN
jgi:hypothetical protein